MSEAKPKRKLSEEARLMSKTEDSVVYFTDDDKTFAGNYYLSSYFPITVSVFGKQFNSSEQAYQWYRLDKLSEMFPEDGYFVENCQAELLQTESSKCHLFEQFTTFYKYSGDSENLQSCLKKKYQIFKNSQRHVDYIRDLKRITALKFLQNRHLMEKLVKTYPKPIRFKRGRSDVSGVSPLYESKAWFVAEGGIICDGYIGEIMTSVREDLISSMLLSDDSELQELAASVFVDGKDKKSCL